MASGIRLEGFDEFARRIAAAPKKIQEEVDIVLDDNAEVILRNMKKALMSSAGNGKALAADLAGGGGVSSTVSKSKLKPLVYNFYAAARYAPYIEFGTGAMVDVPQGLEEYAIQFKGKGVRQVNLPARPFFFPAIRKQEPIIKKDIEEVLNNI